MAQLIVPEPDKKMWPSLGGSLVSFLEHKAVFGPGDLAGQPAVLSPEKQAIIYRAYEVYPKVQQFAGKRRFKRVVWSVRKGLAKTELLGWVSYLELHPEAPVRFDHWAVRGEVSEWGYQYDVGEPVGRPVSSPYIPMLAYSKEQVEELAYGVLSYVCTEGPDADLFDVSLERIIRLDDRGRADGKAVPLAQSPNARDGARTTFQAFDEPHRMYLPRLLQAHQTMNNNLPKRPAADAWSFYVGTAGQLGQKSIAEELYKEAGQIRDGKIKNPRIFFFHRDAGRTHKGREKDATGHNLNTKKGRLAAIKEATGPDGEYGPGQFEDIAELYDRPDTDKGYWERVQLNLWLQSDRQAFDPGLVEQRIVVDAPLPYGGFVTAGFDGARFRDSTAIVLTEVFTGVRWLWGLWERPLEAEGDDQGWEAPIGEIEASVDQLMLLFRVLRFNGDPPHYIESMANWAGKYPVVEEWFTQRTSAMAYAIRDYRYGLRDGTIQYALDPRPAPGSSITGETMGAALRRHVGNAGRKDVNLWDDEGKQLHVLDKIQPERKFDACMADILAEQARIKVLASGDLTAMTTSTSVQRLR